MLNIYLVFVTLFLGFCIGMTVMGFLHSPEGDQFILWYRRQRLYKAHRKHERAKEKYLDVQPEPEPCTRGRDNSA